MTKPFKDLKIAGIINERCYVIEGSILRIYFKLSDNPPKGWSYRFSTVWQAVRYPAKRPAGVEEDALWIESAPEDVKLYHLEQLERAVAQANVDFRSAQRQRAIAERQQAELNSQSRADLKVLSNGLHPNTNSNRKAKSGLKFGIGTARGFLQRLLGKPRNRD